MTRLKVLIVDDSEDDAVLIARYIRKAGYEVEFRRVDTRGEMVAAMATPWDVVISDVNMPRFSGEEALALHRAHAPDSPLIVVSGAVGEETAVAYLKGGADDFVLKGNLPRLVPAIERALRQADNRRARRQAEDDLRAATAELEKALVSKTRFLAAASHDLRQPVQALYCFQEVLQAQLTGHPAEAVVFNLGQSLDGLRVLLDSLLDVSKIDSGLIRPKIEPVALRPLLTRVCGQLALVACQKGLRLHLIACRAVVKTDPVLFERILRNLIENAIKYCEHGRVVIGCRRAGDRLRIEVWDTGIGIPPHLCSQIFEEFFQVANPERDRQKGIGLGLSIVQRLCALLGHSVAVRSQPGRGSTFSVTVPVVGWMTPSPEDGAYHRLCPGLFGEGQCKPRRAEA